MMQAFVPELTEVNPRWIEAWGKEFGNAGVAQAMVANTRISKRVHKDILKAAKIDPSARFNEDEVIPVAQYMEDQQRLVTICGLVLNSEFFRGKVSKEDFVDISRLFNADDLKIAVSLGRLNETSKSFRADSARIADLVENSGRDCVAKWKSALSEQMALRVMLLDPEDADDEAQATTGPDALQASKIVNAVSRAIMDHDSMPGS